ncbi:MAG: protein translocase subunit SecF, partial [Planctomycetes bacterium]|nr:protein translocase subunit SecF [Planctomycetota bacterium]
GVMKNFSMLQFFKKPSTSFVRYRRVTIITSLALIVIGVSIFVVRGKKNYDIDFTGGTLIHLKLNESVPVGTVRNRMLDAGYADAEVQSIWASGDLTHASNGTTEFGVRIKDLENDKIIQKITGDLTRVIGSEMFSRADFDTTSDFRLILKTPVSESEVQGYLLDAAYGYDDIVSIYPLGDEKTTRRYSIRVSGLTNQKSRIGMIKEIASVLSSDLKITSLKPEFGDIKEELPVVSEATKGTQFGVVFSMDVDLRTPVDPLTFQIELNKEGYTDISVTSRETGRRSSFPRKLLITGSMDVLETIQQMGKTVNVPSILIVDNVSVQIELKEGLDEGALRDALSGSGELRKSVGEISGLDVTSDKYAVSMKSLNAAKIQEKIREDIAEIFQHNLYIEKTNLTFDLLTRGESSFNPEPTVDEAGIDTEGASSVDDFSDSVEVLPISMKMDKPASLRTIQGVLSEAGYPDALVDGYEDGKNYHSVNLNTNASELDDMKTSIASAFSVQDPFKRVVSIGSTVAAEMKSRATLALIFACGAIIIYIWFRFGELKFGVAAVLTLVHDVLITIGAVAVADHFGNVFGDIKLSLPMIAAFLTLIGYSLNDTIVLFDRIRENLTGKQRTISKDLVNSSINQNLNRTILTSLTTFGVVLVLYFVGGPAIHGFAFVMMVGVVVGTYSSIFIASPILLEWEYLKKIFKYFFLGVTSPFWFPVSLMRKGK